MKYKYWILIFILGNFLLMSFVLMFNYSIDTFNLFRNKNIEVIKDLQNGNYISYDTVAIKRLDNIYEQLIKKNIKSDVIVIGSSRSMLLHKEIIFKDNTLKYYNFTSGTARLGFYAQVVGTFNKYNVELPKNIILGIDPWVFDRQVSFESIEDTMNRYEENYDIYKQLFNFEYTTINIKTFFKKLKQREIIAKKIIFKNYMKSKNIEELITLKNSNVIMSPHGDLYYPKIKQDIDLNTILKNVNNRIKKCTSNNFDTKCIQYAKLRNFVEIEYFINYLKSKGVSVYIFLAPFEPTYYNYISKNYHFEQYNDEIKNFFKKNDVKIIGSYDPRDFEFTSEYFYDAIHPNERAIEKIFEKFQIK